MAFVAAAPLTVAPAAAQAGLVLSSSSGWVEFSERFVNETASTSATFNTRTVNGATFNELLGPGKGYNLVVDSANGPTQVVSGSISPSSLVAKAVPSTIGDGGFGSGSSTILAVAPSTSVSRGTIKGGGIYFYPVSISDTTDDGEAVMSVNYATATYTNSTDSLAVSGTAGLVLSLTGTLSGAAGDFVAVGMTGDVTISGGSLTTPSTQTFTSVVMGFDGTGGNADFASGSASGTLTSSSNGLSFSATAISTLSSSITVQPGQTVTIRAALTFIGDPSSLDFSTIDPLDPNLPDFGAFLGDAAVPEPSSILMLGLGLAVVGSWGWRRSARRSQSQ